MNFRIPEITALDDQELYLCVDGAQIDALAEQLYNLDGPLELEHLYMFEPYDQLIEVSPYLIKATEPVQQWFWLQNKPTAGFFMSSSLPLESLADHFRQFIKIHPPYGGNAFFKPAHSEAAWVLLSSAEEHFWQGIDYVWVPTRKGLHEMANPFTEVPQPEPLTDWLTLTDEQWQQLGNIAWQNTLDKVTAHMQRWFEPMITKQPDPDVWINQHAALAYKRGMVTEQDLLMYFNIIGFLGEPAVMDSQAYPDIYQLLTQPSAETPSQRVDKAEYLAEEYAKQEHLA